MLAASTAVSSAQQSFSAAWLTSTEQVTAHSSDATMQNSGALRMKAFMWFPPQRRPRWISM